MKYFTIIKDQWMEKNGEMKVLSLGYFAFVCLAFLFAWAGFSIYFSI